MFGRWLFYIWISLANYLKQISSKIYLTSYLDPENISIIMKAHKNWLDFPVITFKEALGIEEFIKNQAESNYLLIDGNPEILTSLAKINPDLIYILIKNSNYKCKNSFDAIKNHLIHPFLGFEDFELPKMLNGLWNFIHFFNKNLNYLYVKAPQITLPWTNILKN